MTNVIPIFDASQVLPDLLPNWTRTILDGVMRAMNGYPYSITDKTAVHLAGLSPAAEALIRATIRKDAKLISNFAFRITKTAGFDAMIKVTITRRIKEPTMRYFTPQTILHGGNF